MKSQKLIIKNTTQKMTTNFGFGRNFMTYNILKFYFFIFFDLL